MFVFSRRAIQEKLELLEDVLSPSQHAKLIASLNRPGRSRLAAMWEVIFLQALSQIASIRYEAALPSGRQPDFSFDFDYSNKIRLTVVGDITSVSDAGLDEKNPVRKLGNEVSRLALKYRLDPNHFRYDVSGEQVGIWPKVRMRLLLPTGEEFTTLIKKVVRPFISDLSNSPCETKELKYDEPGVRFSIRYDKSQCASGGGHPSYDVAMSLTENPIYPALRAKANQLRGAPNDAIRLIILCDGDCAALRNFMFGGMGTYAGRQIATEFLRKTNAVDLVLLVTVEKLDKFSLSLRDYVMRYDLTAAPQHDRSHRINDDIIAAISTLLEQSVKTIPKPMTDACNAALRCELNSYGLGMHGGYSMGGNKIKISARLVQELLAGDVTVDRFAEMHGWRDSAGHMANPFKRALERGELISKINVINCGDEDDNQFEFNFGSQDPAISPFHRKGD